MYKKVLSAILFGALTIASTSTFVSCKDYDDDIKSLKEQITANDTDNAALHTALTALETKVADLKTQLEAEDARLAALIQKLQTATEENKTAIQNEAKRAAAAEAALEARIATAEAAIAELKTLTADLKNNKVDKTEFNTKVQDIYAKIEAVETNLGSALTQIASLSQGLQNEETARKAAIADLQQQINALNAYTARVQTLEGSLGTVETSVGTLSTQLGQEAQKLQNTSSSVEDLKQTVTNITNQITQITQQISNVNVINVLVDNSLRSLVFRPDSYYWGIEATKITRLTPKYYMEQDNSNTNAWYMKQLTSYIDDASKRDEVVGTKGWTSQVKENAVDYDVAGVLTDHDRYQQSTGTITVMLNAVANYHMNPSTAVISDDDNVKIVSDNKNYTRARGNAKVSVLGASTGAQHSWSTANGILTVPLKVENTVSTVVNTAVDNTNSYVTVFATQVELADTTITSDYAAIVEEVVSNLRLSHVKHNPSATAKTDPDFIETELFNDHCGECDIYKNTANKKMGMHLYGTVGEAKYKVTHKARKGDGKLGEGQDLVQYQQDIDLTALVETHYTPANGGHAKFEGENFTRNFEYRFELTDFRLGDNATNESAHAAIYQDATTGHYFLHPQDPAVGGLNGRAYDPAKATDVVVNRVPLVRVSLVYKGDATKRVVDYGYLPIRITKEAVAPTPPVYIFHAYKSTASKTVTRYNECWMTGGSSVNAITTTWRQTEEDLMSHVDLKDADGNRIVLTREKFEEVYGNKAPAGYGPQCTASTVLTDLDQYYITNESAYLNSGARPTFAPVVASPIAKQKLGVISYEPDPLASEGMATSIFKWDLDVLEIRAMAGTYPIATRAVKLASSEPLNYPDLYVIFTSGEMKLENKDVTIDMKVVKNRINDYWYKFANETDQGYDHYAADNRWYNPIEIHTNVITPEEGDQSGMGDGTYLIWKPTVMENIFANVFLNNFNSGDFYTWCAISGAPTASGQPFIKSNLKLDMIFDDSGNGTYKGYTDAGAAKTFTVSNTTATDKSKKNLYATYNLVTEKIASIDAPLGPWDGTSATRTQLKAMKISLNWNSAFAKALLNYVSHEYIGANDVLKATIAVLPMSQNAGAGASPVTLSNVNATDGTAKVTAAIKYTDAGATKYCAIKVSDYKFDVRFLRPISLDKAKNTEIEDATSGENQAQQIDLSELISGFTDYRGNEVAAGGPVINWKSAADGDALDYEEYYAPAGTNKFTVSIPTVAVGQYISSNVNVKTNLNQSNVNNFVPLNTVSQELDFKLVAPGVLEYRNNKATVREFQVQIPVEIGYYWGTIYDNVTITIKKTQGNVKKQ